MIDDACQPLLDEQLAARALSLAADPATSTDAAADALISLALGNVTTLERALHRIAAHAPDRPSRVTATASDGLRLAIDRITVPSEPHEAPKPSEAPPADATLHSLAGVVRQLARKIDSLWLQQPTSGAVALRLVEASHSLHRAAIALQDDGVIGRSYR